ncbi:hypothetical protein JOB18_017572 [Solea senegalensis]|uniref:Uncharacterized protein n=1 Tax=Solea senegalensis TaxID=28829 RepID=A0AAV6T6B1_SOLSE|nr:hypothetical protein JOB18_017572 [Solea senegalensis]
MEIDQIYGSSVTKVSLEVKEKKSQETGRCEKVTDKNFCFLCHSPLQERHLNKEAELCVCTAVTAVQEEQKVLPLSSLRLLPPSLRVIQAVMWKHYGKVEKFVSLVTEADWLGLRAKMVLHTLCSERSKELVQTHLNGLLLTCTKQNVFPVKYGPLTRHWSLSFESLLHPTGGAGANTKQCFAQKQGASWEHGQDGFQWRWVTSPKQCGWRIMTHSKVQTAAMQTRQQKRHAVMLLLMFPQMHSLWEVLHLPF